MLSVFKTILQLRKEGVQNVLMDKKHLFRIAYGRPAGLGVFDDGKGHVLIRILIDEHVADARTGFDAGNGRFSDACLNETGAAAGDQKIHISLGMHELGGTVMTLVFDQLNAVLTDARLCQAFAQRFDNRIGAFPGVSAAS